MLTLQDLKGFLAGVTYKPGWSFHVYGSSFMELALLILVKTQDAERPGRLTDLSCNFPLDPHLPKEAIPEFLRSSIIHVEMHEIDEWLRINGDFFRHPHPWR